MNKNILKYFGLAVLMALGANAGAATIEVAAQDGLENAIKSANADDTIKLAAGTFTTYGKDYAKGKTLKFEGTTDGDGVLQTTWNYGSVNIVNGEGGSDYSFEGSVVNFTNVKFHDNCNNGKAGYRGFVRLGGGSFTGCTFDTLLVYLGDGTVTFKECVFNMPDYCFWAYGIRSLNFDTCTFNSTAGKFINAYIEGAQAFDVCINIKDCTFNGGAVKYPAVKIKKDNNYIVAFTGTQTFNNVGKGSATDSQYFEIESGIKPGTTVTIGGSTVWANGHAVEPTPAYDPTKWSGATYEAFATEPTTVEAANKFIADLPAVVKDYISVDAANKTVALSSADAFAFITYLPKYLAALRVLDCDEKGYGDPRLSAYWVGAEHHSWTVNVTTDIDLQNQAWKPATSGYSYLVDFQNHTISNLKATGLTTNGGLFGDLYYAQNVTIDGAEVATTADNAGVLAGALNGFAKNVSVKNATLSGGKYAGAIGGYVYGDIEGCKVVGTESAPVVITSATKEVGAVAGLFTASLIKECEVAFVSVTGQEEVGGIVGRVLDGDVKKHSIEECTVANVTLKATKNGDATVDPGVVGGSAANFVGTISGRDYHESLTITAGGQQLYPAIPEVVPEKPTEEEAKEATKVIDESGEVVTPSEQEKAAAKTEVEKVAQSFDNPEIAKVETHVAEAAMTVTGEGEEQKVVVKSAIVEELQKAAPQGTIDQITSESDVKSYVKVALNEAKVAVKDEGAALKSVTFDVKPMAETTVAVGVEKKVVVAQIPNEEIAKPITFRLPLTDAFTASAIVTHEGDPDRLCMVQGEAGGRYVEVTASHFSLFTVTPSDIVETKTESTTVLGIKRVDYTVTQSTADLAAAVPWLMAAEANMPVSGLITTGLSEGDQIQVYEKSANAYYTWLYRDGEWAGAASGAPLANAYTLERGRAFWYKPAGNKTAGTYTQVGLYSTASITSRVDVATVGSASFANPVHFLMASPKYENFNLKEKLTRNAGCRDNDVVVVVATGARYRFNGTVWGQDIDTSVTKFGVTVTQKVFEPTEGEIIVPAGTAFWYLSAGGAPEFEW